MPVEKGQTFRLITRHHVNMGPNVFILLPGHTAHAIEEEEDGKVYCEFLVQNTFAFRTSIPVEKLQLLPGPTALLEPI